MHMTLIQLAQYGTEIFAHVRAHSLWLGYTGRHENRLKCLCGNHYVRDGKWFTVEHYSVVKREFDSVVMER